MKWEREERKMRLHQDYGTIDKTPIGSVTFAVCLGGGGMMAIVTDDEGNRKNFILPPSVLLTGLFKTCGIQEEANVIPEGGVQVKNILEKKSGQLNGGDAHTRAY